MTHVSFYLATTKQGLTNNLIGKKIGIVYSRHPKYRLEEYRTFDSTVVFHRVAVMNISVEQLFQIEKNALAATRHLNPDLDKWPNNESRFGVSCDELWSICEKYLINAKVYNNIDDITEQFREEKEEKRKLFEDYDDLITFVPQLPIQLRPHQDITLITKYFMERAASGLDRCGILHMAPGSGKTLYAISWLNSMQFINVIVFVPSLLLKQQWEEQLRRHYFGKVVEKLNESGDSYKITVQLYVNSGKVTEQIHTCGNRYSYCDYYIDCIIMDEIHHVANPKNKTNRKVFDIKTNYTLGLTATSRKGEEQIFKNIIYTLPIRQAIERRLITDYGVYIARITEEYAIEIRNKIESNASLELIISAYMVLKLLSEGIVKKTFIVCNEISNAALVNDIIRRLINKKIVDVNTFHCYLSGEDSIKVRKAAINEFVNCERGIITSVYLFGEGVDFPCVDCVCVAENMSSVVRIVQTLMRCNRLDPANRDKIGSIILPIIKTDTINDGRFKKVKKVINEMRNEDTGIFDTISIMNVTNKKTQITRKQESKEMNEDDFKYLNSIKLELLDGFESSLKGFVERMKAAGIYNELEYKRHLSANPDSKLPYQPERKYPGFKWSMVSNADYYTYDECYNRISELLKTNKIEGLPSEKNKKLCELDTRIPNDIFTYYGDANWNILNGKVKENK